MYVYVFSLRKRKTMATRRKPAGPAKRITKELAEISLDPPGNCSAAPKGDNVYEWVATVMGPKGTVYEGGVFFLDVVFPSNYPFKPPKVLKSLNLIFRFFQIVLCHFRLRLEHASIIAT